MTREPGLHTVLRRSGRLSWRPGTPGREAGSQSAPMALFGDFGVERLAVWVQRYDPLGSWPLSTLAAALPILVLLGLLATGRASAGKSALAGLVTACAVAFLVFGMPASMIAGKCGGGGGLRRFPHRLADRGRRVPLRPRGEHRPVRGDESLGRQALGGSPAPGGSRGLLVRGVHRGSGRVSAPRWPSRRRSWWDWGSSRSRRPCSA